MILATILLLSLGACFVVLGRLIWKKEMISLLHDYHTNNVTPENKAHFCKLSGLGVIIIGVAMIISGALLFKLEALSFIPFAVGFVIGILMLVSAGKKYNK